MTIPKRDKRKRRVEKSLAYPPANKMVEYPDVQKVVKYPNAQKVIHYPRVCPYCGRESMSTICKCGRLTKIK